MGYTHWMVITADARRRVTLPKSASPGDVFDLEKTDEGRFILTRLAKPARRIKLIRKQGFLVASTGRRITMAETRTLLDQLP